MIAVHRLRLLRSVSGMIGALLVIVSILGMTAELTRPLPHAAELFSDRPERPAEPSTTAAAVSLDGDVRSDVAAAKARLALGAPASSPERARANADAQTAVLAAVGVSPVNSPMWLALSLLRNQNDTATPTLKMSYLTGPLPRDATVKRLQAVATSKAVQDEEIQLLAQPDVRTVLTATTDQKPALLSIYRQATAPGKAFLLAAADIIDASSGAMLRQSR